MITQKQMLKLLRKWEPIAFSPEHDAEYREFTCAECGRKIRKAWHIHCLIGGYKREFHLCKKDGRLYGLGTRS